MTRSVVLGKGPIGTTLARLLAAQGHDVLVLSRSGGPQATARTGDVGRVGTEHPRVTHAAVDATDAAAVTSAARDAQALYSCLNPAYHRWAADWPPVTDALLAAAEATGAVLVLAGNLYSYGAGTRLMREDSPLASTETKGRVRGAMWTRALERHRAGHLRVTEVRGSDYLGPLAEAHAHAGPRMLDPLLAGRRLWPLGSADQPHTWTYLPDFAHALAAAATTPDAWGRPWHVPSPEPLTFRELAARFAEAAGAPRPRITAVPMGVVRALGLGAPMMRELHAVGYQFTEPFVMDSAASQATLGTTPTPWPTIVAETLAAR